MPSFLKSYRKIVAQKHFRQQTSKHSANASFLDCVTRSVNCLTNRDDEATSSVKCLTEAISFFIVGLLGLVFQIHVSMLGGHRFGVDATQRHLRNSGVTRNNRPYGRQAQAHARRLLGSTVSGVREYARAHRYRPVDAFWFPVVYRQCSDGPDGKMSG
jgi:hypothetical protein